jgi:hypothetical protein
MANLLRFTRQVESSMMMLTGTRARGLSTHRRACFGRSPGSCASRRLCTSARQAPSH